MSQLQNLILMLSKASPQAVYTPKQLSDHEPKSIFDYLYIETAIEKRYKELLGEYRDSKVIIFLCGSSGDGKSAIIGQNQKYYGRYYDVHIDATHSFKPDQSAVDALNEKFSSYKQGNKPLVVGINIGILLNFAREGSNEHEDICHAIRNYISNGTSSHDAMFINFEDYSKFEMEHDRITSSFIHQLIDKITASIDSNPFYKTFQEDQHNSILGTVHKNFQLLQLEAIKNSIVELLVTVHLKYDQFLTTRSLLDFFYTLLAGPELLVHTLFDDTANAIIENIRKEDPCLLRTTKLDTFILERKSNKTDTELNAFIDQFNANFTEPILSLNNPHLLVRVFYLFRNHTCATNYHQQFKEEFQDQTTHDFIELLYAHEQYNEKPILDFYDKLEKAILAYANKQLPTLSAEGLITLSEINNYALCTSVEFDPDLEVIKRHTKHHIHSFPCCLQVNDQPLETIEVSLSMYKLIHAINDGYRPNKHDRNTIVIFEELIERIIDFAKDTNKLIIVHNEQIYEFKDTAGKLKVKSHAR
jgi:DNA phosphorothioation-dependent restriction protein DptF